MSTISNTPGSNGPRKRKGALIGGGIALAVVLAAGVTVAVVASQNGGDDAPAEAEGYDLVTDGTLTIGTEGTYKPFTFHDESGELTGYDVEIAEAVAEKLGLEVRFEETEWDGIFAGLEAGRFDVIANQVSINEERQAQYLLSEPYTVSPGVIIVSADNTDIEGFDDLEGKRAAQSATSNWYELSASYGAEIETVEGWNESIALLRDGRIDYTLNDKLTFLDYVQTEGATDIKEVAETDDPSLNAFALAQGNDELLADIDAALAELAADGTLAEIGEKYFGVDVSQ